jgi:hypothetical protein
MSSPEPRRVLIATYEATSRSGTDLYTRDLALALLRRGWQPVVYATALGLVAQELREATIPVTDDITSIGAPPDVIHGHHHLETLTALARFPGVPALFVCHDGLTWHSTPPHTARIGVYVAVDRNCRDRVVMEHGVPETSIRLLQNAVDLSRFRRRPSLPATPRRAVIFSNNALPDAFGATIRDVCEKRGISLDIIGIKANTATDCPESALLNYDLVFAKARCALEGAATGAAVIICDSLGLAGMLTTRDLDAMRQLNFGMRLLQRPITQETIGTEIDRYDAADAGRVTDSVRGIAGIDLLAEQFIELYDELRASPALSAEQDLGAIAESLSRLSKHIQLARPASAPNPSLMALLKSRALGVPVRLLRRLKKRLPI